MEFFRRTTKFDYVPGADSLYYSYSTCKNNSIGHFTNFITTQSSKRKFISSVVPEMMFPRHYKEGFNNGDIDGGSKYGDGDEITLYRNNTIPWKGFLLHYLNDVLEMSDIGGLNYVPRSVSSSVSKTSSSYTASGTF